LLDTYEDERRPVAEFNGEQCMHNTRQMEKTGFLAQDKSLLSLIETPEGEQARQAIAAGILAQSALLASHGQQFGYQYSGGAVVPDGTEIVSSSVADYHPTARPGARAPHSWVAANGKRISTIDVYDGGFILLTGPDNGGWVRAAEQARTELAVPVKALGLGIDLLPVDELIADLLARYGLEPSGAILIRPDGFVGFRSASGSGQEYQALRRALQQILNLHAETVPAPTNAR
jgi:hypothetical protein